MGRRQIWRISEPGGFPTLWSHREELGGQTPGRSVEVAEEVIDVTPPGADLIVRRFSSDGKRSQLGLISAIRREARETFVAFEKPAAASSQWVSTANDGKTFYFFNRGAEKNKRSSHFSLSRFQLTENMRKEILALPGDWTVEDVIFENRFLLRRQARAKAEFYLWQPDLAHPRKINFANSQVPHNLQMKHVQFGRGGGSYVCLLSATGYVPGLYSYSSQGLKLIATDEKAELQLFQFSTTRTELVMEWLRQGKRTLEVRDPVQFTLLPFENCPECSNSHLLHISRYGRNFTLEREVQGSSGVDLWQSVYDRKERRLSDWIFASPISKFPKVERLGRQP